MSRRIVILGAGVCGLAAAWRLLEKDPTLDVTLLEQEERPGGLARSLTINGQVTDLGPHRIFTELPDVQDFLRDLCGDQLEEVKRASKMWLRGGWIEYPPKPVEIARHLGVGRLAGAGASYALHKAGSLFGEEKSRQESFESLMIDAFGPELYKLLVGPYARKVWKVDPTEIHGDIARVRVSAGGLDQMVKKLLVGERKDQITAVKKFHYIAGGVESLVRKLRDGVEARGGKIRLVREVVSVKQFRTGHLQVLAKDRETLRTENHQAEVVLSTIPVSQLLEMLLEETPDETVAKAREGLRYIANFLVCVVVNRPRVTESQWLYFPEKDTVFNRGYEPRNFHESMGSGKQGMIVLEITAQEGDSVYRRSDRALTEATLKGLERVGLVARKDVVTTHVHRIPYTYPFYDLGYRERLGRIISYLEKFPNLVSLGRQGLFLHNNMDHSIHMGFRAAQRVTEAPDNLAASYYQEVRRFQQFRIVD